MGVKYKRPTGKEVLRVLEKEFGFERVRHGKGSHIILRKYVAGKYATIPIPPYSGVLRNKLLGLIIRELKEIGITKQEFLSKF